MIAVRRLRALVPILGLTACAGSAPDPATVLPTPQIITIRPTATAAATSLLAGPLVFASYRDGESEIYLLNTLSAEPVRLTDQRERVSKPTWSPDGRTLAIVVTDREFNLDIYLLDLETGVQTRLTDELRVDTDPAFSPDGTRIAFSSDRDSYVTVADGLIYEFEVYVMNADGSDQRNLTNSPGWDTSPSWSPDGRRIVFQSDRDGNPEIYVMNADGSGQTNLTRNAADDGAPSWSPDGSRIVFHSARSGLFNIFVMDADGSQVRQLTDTILWDMQPAWSPDGSQIAFYSNRDGNFEIYVMHTDGSMQLRLTAELDFDGFPDWKR